MINALLIIIAGYSIKIANHMSTLLFISISKLEINDSHTMKKKFEAIMNNLKKEIEHENT